MEANGVLPCQLRRARASREGAEAMQDGVVDFAFGVDAGKLFDEAIPVAAPGLLPVEHFQGAVGGVVEEHPARQGRRNPFVANPGRPVVAHVLDAMNRSNGSQLVEATNRHCPTADESSSAVSASYGGEQEEEQCE